MTKKKEATEPPVLFADPEKCAECGKKFDEEHPSFIEDPRGTGQRFHPHACYTAWIGHAAERAAESSPRPSTSSQIDAQEQEHLVTA